MKLGKRTVRHIICIVIGIILFVWGTVINDSFWSGMGSALVVVGIIRMVGLFRLKKNEEYREQVEIEATDERNLFIRDKASAWSGYLFIIIAAVCTIVFKVIGQDILSMASSMAVCLYVLLYWVAFLIIRKKY